MTINANYPQIYISTEIKGVESFTKSEWSTASNAAKKSREPRPGTCLLGWGIWRSLVASDRIGFYLRKLKDIER